MNKNNAPFWPFVFKTLINNLLAIFKQIIVFTRIKDYIFSETDSDCKVDKASPHLLLCILISLKPLVTAYLAKIYSEAILCLVCLKCSPDSFGLFCYTFCSSISSSTLSLTSTSSTTSPSFSWLTYYLQKLNIFLLIR